MIPCPVCAEELVKPPQGYGSDWLCWTCAFEVTDHIMMKLHSSRCADCEAVIVPGPPPYDKPDYLCVVCRGVHV